MGGSDTALQAFENIHRKVVDVHRSYVALIEKMAQLQVEATVAEMDFVSDELAKPFVALTSGVDVLEELRQGIEVEKNRLLQA